MKKKCLDSRSCTCVNCLIKYESERRPSERRFVANSTKKHMNHYRRHVPYREKKNIENLTKIEDVEVINDIYSTKTGRILKNCERDTKPHNYLITERCNTYKVDLKERDETGKTYISPRHVMSDSCSCIICNNYKHVKNSKSKMFKTYDTSKHRKTCERHLNRKLRAPPIFKSKQILSDTMTCILKQIKTLRNPVRTTSQEQQMSTQNKEMRYPRSGMPNDIAESKYGKRNWDDSYNDMKSSYNIANCGDNKTDAWVKYKNIECLDHLSVKSKTFLSIPNSSHNTHMLYTEDDELSMRHHFIDVKSEPSSFNTYTVLSEKNSLSFNTTESITKSTKQVILPTYQSQQSDKSVQEKKERPSVLENLYNIDNQLTIENLDPLLSNRSLFSMKMIKQNRIPFQQNLHNLNMHADNARKKEIHRLGASVSAHKQNGSLGDITKNVYRQSINIGSKFGFGINIPRVRSPFSFREHNFDIDEQRSNKPFTTTKYRQQKRQKHVLQNKYTLSKVNSERSKQFMKKCYCALNLRKRKKQDTRQRLLNISSPGTDVNYQIKKINKRYAMSHETFESRPEIKTRNKSIFTRKRIRYCEPRICVPYKCDPYTCERRRHSQTKSSSTDPYTKSVTTSVSVAISKLISKRTQKNEHKKINKNQELLMHEKKEHVIHEQDTHIPFRQFVRIGSKISCNIECLNDRIRYETDYNGKKRYNKRKGKRVNSDYDVSLMRKQKKRVPKSKHNKTQNNDAFLNTTLGSRKKKKQTKTMNKKGFLNRCFCTFKLLNKDPDDIDKTSTLHTDPVKDSKKNRNKYNAKSKAIRTNANSKLTKYYKQQPLSSVASSTVKPFNAHQTKTFERERRIRKKMFPRLYLETKGKSNHDLSRQFVRIGSNFNVDIELYKDNFINKIPRQQSKVQQKIKPKEQIRLNGMNKKQTVHKNVIRHTVSQSNKNKTNQISLTSRIKRCLCTLKFRRKDSKGIVRTSSPKSDASKPKTKQLKKEKYKNPNNRYTETNKINDKKYKFKYYEYLPYECDPHQSLKRVNKQKKYTKSSSTDPIIRSTISSDTKSTNKVKSKRTQTDFLYSDKDKISRKQYDQHHQLVRIGSNFSFNVGFFKENLSKNENESNVILKQNQKLVNKQKNIKVNKRVLDQKTLLNKQSLRDMKKTYNEKKKQSIVKIETTSKINNEYEKYKTNRTNEKSNNKRQGNRIKLKPYECEPGLCIPGECDPLMCFKRMNERRSVPRSKRTHQRIESNLSYTNKLKNRKTKKTQSDNTQFHKKLTIKRHRVTESSPGKIENPVISSETSFHCFDRQAVRIGSSCNFNIELYKRSTEKEILDKRKGRHKKLKKTVLKQDAPKILSQNLTKRKNKGLQLNKIMLQRTAKPYNKNMEDLKNNVNFFKRCLCKLNLFNVEKAKSSRKSSTQTANVHSDKKYKKHSKALEIDNKKDNSKIFYNLMPYECEPGICIPYQCDPVECLKRTEKRDKHSIPSSTDKVTTSKARTNFDPISKLYVKQTQTDIRGRELKQNNLKSFNSTKRSARRKHFINNRHTRGVVRIGSNFSFNIDFFKDKCPMEASLDKKIISKEIEREPPLFKNKHKKYASKDKIPRKKKYLTGSKYQSNSNIKTMKHEKKYNIHDRKKKNKIFKNKRHIREGEEDHLSQLYGLYKPKENNITDTGNDFQIYEKESKTKRNKTNTRKATQMRSREHKLLWFKNSQAYTKKNKVKSISTKTISLVQCLCHLKFRKSQPNNNIKPNNATISGSRAITKKLDSNARGKPKPKIKDKLQSYECEPEICIPYQCDPLQCLKRIYERQLRSQTEKTKVRNHNYKRNKSVISVCNCPLINEVAVHSKTKKTQSDSTRVTKKYSSQSRINVLETDKTDIETSNIPINNLNQELVELRSNSNFHLDKNRFSTGHGIVDRSKYHRIHNSQESYKNKVNVHKIKGQKSSIRLNSNHFLKRCFCRLYVDPKFKIRRRSNQSQFSKDYFSKTRPNLISTSTRQSLQKKREMLEKEIKLKISETNNDKETHHRLRHAPRINSNFTYNIEFSKEKLLSPDDSLRTNRESTTNTHLGSLSNNVVDKYGRNKRVIFGESTIIPIMKHLEESQTLEVKKSKRRGKAPLTCCDSCVQRIKKCFRLSKSSNSGPSAKYVQKMYNELRSILSKRLRKDKKIEEQMLHNQKNKTIEQNEYNPRQMVQIGSNISFEINFFKDTLSPLQEMLNETDAQYSNQVRDQNVRSNKFANDLDKLNKTSETQRLLEHKEHRDNVQTNLTKRHQSTSTTNRDSNSSLFTESQSSFNKYKDISCKCKIIKNKNALKQNSSRTTLTKGNDSFEIGMGINRPIYEKNTIKQNSSLNIPTKEKGLFKKRIRNNHTTESKPSINLYKHINCKCKILNNKKSIIMRGSRLITPTLKKSSFETRMLNKYTNKKNYATESKPSINLFKHINCKCKILKNNQSTNMQDSSLITPTQENSSFRKRLGNKHTTETLVTSPSSSSNSQQSANKCECMNTIHTKPFSYGTSNIVMIALKNDNNKKTRTKLKPYECEPNECVPYECNPEECFKRIMKRTKHSKTSSMQTASSKSRAHKNQTNESEQRKRSKATISKITPKKSKIIRHKTESEELNLNNDRITKAEDNYDSHHVLRIESSFSFNIECSKNSIVPERDDQMKSHEKPKIQSLDTKLNDKSLQNKISLKHTGSQVDDKKENKSVVNKMKRCFYTWKLCKNNVDKKDNKFSIGSSTPKHFQKDRIKIEANKSVATDKQQILKTYKLLDPYECEPGVCVPNECDPYKCLDKIKSRVENPKPLADLKEKVKTNYKLKRESKKPYYKNDTENTNHPSRQTVRIGSSFSFSIELFKNRIPSEEAMINRLSASSRNKNNQIHQKNWRNKKSHNKKHKSTHSITSKRHREIQCLCKHIKKSVMTDSTDRCFCTLELSSSKKNAINHSLPLKQYIPKDVPKKPRQNKNTECLINCCKCNKHGKTNHFKSAQKKPVERAYKKPMIFNCLCSLQSLKRNKKTHKNLMHKTGGHKIHVQKSKVRGKNESKYNCNDKTCIFKEKHGAGDADISVNNMNKYKNKKKVIPTPKSQFDQENEVKFLMPYSRKKFHKHISHTKIIRAYKRFPKMPSHSGSQFCSCETMSLVDKKESKTKISAKTRDIILHENKYKGYKKYHSDLIRCECPKLLASTNSLKKNKHHILKRFDQKNYCECLTTKKETNFSLLKSHVAKTSRIQNIFKSLKKGTNITKPKPTTKSREEEKENKTNIDARHKTQNNNCPVGFFKRYFCCKYEQNQTEPKEEPKKPFFKLLVDSRNMCILNIEEVGSSLSYLMRKQQAKSKKSNEHESSCECCRCLKKKTGHKSDDKRHKKLPNNVDFENTCVCGNKECEQLFMKKKKPLNDVNKTEINDKKQKTNRVKSKAVAEGEDKMSKLKINRSKLKEKEKMSKKMAAIHKKEQSEMRKGEVKIEKQQAKYRKKQMKIHSKVDAIRRKRRKKEEKYALKQMKKYQQSGDCLLLSESLLDVAKLSLDLTAGCIRRSCRALMHPKVFRDEMKMQRDTYRYNPAGAWDTFVNKIKDSSIAATYKRIKLRFASMRIVQNFKQACENHPVTNYLIHMFDRDPTHRMRGTARRRRRKEPIEFGCSLYMASMRKRPCLWVYYKCPWFYPHCISLLNVWRQVLDVFVFVLAVGVWSPCIIGMELCRALMCCTMCTA